MICSRRVCRPTSSSYTSEGGSVSSGKAGRRMRQDRAPPASKDILLCPGGEPDSRSGKSCGEVPSCLVETDRRRGRSALLSDAWYRHRLRRGTLEDRRQRSSERKKARKMRRVEQDTSIEWLCLYVYDAKKEEKRVKKCGREGRERERKRHASTQNLCIPGLGLKLRNRFRCRLRGDKSRCQYPLLADVCQSREGKCIIR